MKASKIKLHFASYAASSYAMCLPLMMVTQQDWKLARFIVFFLIAPIYVPVSFVSYLGYDLSGSVGRPLVGWEQFLPILIVISVGIPAYLSAKKRLSCYRIFRDQQYGYCMKCGYDLRGSNESMSCPECGQAINHETKRSGET